MSEEERQNVIFNFPGSSSVSDNLEDVIREFMGLSRLSPYF